MQVPDTWEEFLQAAARKVSSSRMAIASVETLDTGTVLEELDEIMHGDKLVIRCSGSSDSPAHPPSSIRSVGRHCHISMAEPETRNRKP